MTFVQCLLGSIPHLPCRADSLANAAAAADAVTGGCCPSSRSSYLAPLMTFCFVSEEGRVPEEAAHIHDESALLVPVFHT